MSFAKLRPVKNVILFTFLDETSGAAGHFTERTKSLIIVPKLSSTQRQERWVKVQAIGPDVADIKVGDLLLLQALGWTRSEKFEGEKIWMTNDTKVLLVTNDEKLTLTF